MHFSWGPKGHVHDPMHVLLVGLNHMQCMALCPMQNFLIRFGAPKLYAFPVCKCYAFLNILLGYPLCLTTTHKYIILILILYKYIGFRYNYILIDMESPFLHGPFSSFFQDYHPFTIRGMDFQAESYSNQTWT